MSTPISELGPEPPDLTRIEFEYWTDIYGAWRDDAEGARAGWPTGDGAPNWVVYGRSVPMTWIELGQTFSPEALNAAVRLIDHPDDVGKRDQWPTQQHLRGTPSTTA